jgi:hypothetical protein
MSRIDVLRNFIIMLVLSGSLAPQAAGNNDSAEDAGGAATNEPVEARDSRNGPSLDAATGVRYVIAGDQIRRFGLVTLRSVPGMEVMGMHTSSSRAR